MSAAGRPGTSIISHTLLHETLSYANLQVRETRTVAGATSEEALDLDGLLAGAGVEMKFCAKAYAKSEYRYGNYADGYTGSQMMTGIALRF